MSISSGESSRPNPPASRQPRPIGHGTDKSGAVDTERRVRHPVPEHHADNWISLDIGVSCDVSTFGFFAEMIQPKRLAYCLKIYWADVALSVLLYVAVSIAVDRVWRFPFDDEIHTLKLFESNSLLELLRYELGGNEVHPPLFYIFYGYLKDLGLSVPHLRLLSLAFTASSLAVVHLLTLAMVRRDDMSIIVRTAGILLFGLNALAISQGDALRWYPMFAFLVSMFLLLYLSGRNLWSAPLLGLCLATNYLGLLVIVSVAIDRYAVQRRFDLRTDVAFWSITAAAGWMAFVSAAALLRLHAGSIRGQLSPRWIEAPAQDALGFFGGHTLGIGQAWLVLPALLVTLWALSRVYLRGTKPDVVLLLLSTVLIMPAIGFAKPRSFLYLAPLVSGVICVALSRSSSRAQIIAIVASLITTTAAIANIKGNDHPFKREAAIPYGAAIDFIVANGGRSLLMTTDPVIAWEISHDQRTSTICVSGPGSRRHPGCGLRARYDSVIVAHGFNIRSREARGMDTFDTAVASATTDFHRSAVARFGSDRDAALKRRLTGAPLGESILTIDIYTPEK